VQAVAADRLVRDQLTLGGTPSAPLLQLGEHAVDPAEFRRLRVVGAGKAGAAMVRGLWEAWQSICRAAPNLAEIRLEGLVSVPAGTESEVPAECPIEVAAGRPAGINEPTATGVALARRILQIVSSCGPGDGCLVLLSGGGSALLPLPRDGITLEEQLSVIRHLSGNGADIEALNIVRKHLSDIKGGKLAAACRADWLVTLIISDVLGDPLDLIASGPTVPDRSSPRDALQILARFDPERCLPAAVYDVLDHAANAASEDAPQPSSHGLVSLIGNNATAVDAAGMEAERRGYSAMMWSHPRSEGTAEQVGQQLAEMTLKMLEDRSPQRPDCMISGGEPVVMLAPAEIRGRGGRNQQLVLAALQRFRAEPAAVQQQLRQRVTLLSGGTDGEDGPTDAAGAWLDGAVWERADQLRLDAEDALARNDAHTFFKRAGGLLRTGPTGTNVCDLRVVTIAPPTG
jgi:glycerate-2-kinase